MRGARRRRLPRFLLAQLLLAVVLTCVSWTDQAHAYSWMIRHGYTACATCHADPTGGELLTPYGRVTADLILRMQYKERPKDAPPPKPGALWGLWEPPSQLLLGGAYRNLYLIRPDLDEDNFVAFGDFQTHLFQHLIYFIGEHYSSILGRTHNMI